MDPQAKADEQNWGHPPEECPTQSPHRWRVQNSAIFPEGVQPPGKP